MKTSPSNPVSRVARSFIFFWFVVVASTGFAQLDPNAASAGYRVGEVKIQFNGAATVSEQVVRANMQLRPGVVMEDATIDQDIRSLYRTGLFEFIEVKRDVRPDRTVNLLVDLTPKYRVLSVRYEGNAHVRSRRLDKEVKSKANSPLDERQVKEDAQKIKEYYQKSGYNQVAITYDITRDRDSGFGNVIFKIKEGPKVRISDIRFIGNDHVKPRRLRKEMETRRWWMFSWLTGTGRLKDDKFEDDLEKLRDYYREQGYLDVEIDQQKVIYDYPKPNKLVITIPVTEGRQYRIGEITITGPKLYPVEALKVLLRRQSGMVFSPSKIDKDREGLEDFYGRDGYLETNIRVIKKPNVSTGNIDLEYEIAESEKFYVESVRIEGNTKSKSIVILRELVLGPGDVFNTYRMKISKSRLDNTRFFDDVNLAPETTNIPGRRNLKVAVQEARTGNLTFGAGFSSLERAVVFAELTQGNFDLFNRKSFFQGDGQKFRIKLQVGSRSSEAIISFEEPWLFERELTLGFSIYRTSQNYENTNYAQTVAGGEIYLRKRLFELFEGKLTYGYDTVKISEVVSGFNLPESTYQVSKAGFQLLRENRDRIVNTTFGNRMEINTEVTGGALGGDLDTYMVEFRGSQFLRLFETQTQVIGVIGRLGVMDSYGDGDDLAYGTVGSTRLFTLGGPYTLRGFENIDVGPKDFNGQALGGRSYGMMTLEYSLDIVNPIRFVVFYDAGFVNIDAYDFSPARYNDNFGFGIRLFVAGSPLSLEYGIPITTDRFNDKGGQFNFSFGTRF